MITLKSYLQQEWQQGSDEGASFFNPTTGELLGRASTKGLNLAGALQFARNVGGPNLRKMSFRQRAELLKALSAALRADREQLLETSVISGGTTRSDAKFDVDGAIGTLAYYADLGATLEQEQILVEGDGEKLARSPRFCGYHIKTPLRGAALHINAFNFPAWGMAEKAAVSILAGVPVITKPATSTSLLAFRVMESLVNADVLPAGSWQFVGGSAGDLCTHLAGQDLLAFTGSASTAAILRALPNVIEESVSLNVEADSLNAAVLAPDVDDDTYQMFLRTITKEITQKTGQKCTATRRIFVSSDAIDRVVEDLRERLSAIKIGDPSSSETQMGPLATQAQLKDARQGLATLVETGAKIVSGGPDSSDHDWPKEGFFIAPTLLRADSPASSTAVHHHEVFAPAATVMPYQSAAEVVELVALGGGGLVASLYSDDREFTGEVLLGLAPYHGRIFVGSAKVADVATAPGMVLPSCVHGGPGRAGGGEELGGLRALDFYMQRTAIQGDRGVLDRLFGLR